MTEDIQINISGNIDSSALQELRKQLNDARNELNAVARETEKTSQKYKELKATTAELNRLMKLSDADLKRYAQTLVQTEQATNKVTASKNKLVNATSNYGVKLGNVKSNLAQYSSQLVNVAQSTDQGTEAITKQVGQLALFAGGWVSVAAGIGLAVDANRDWVNTQLESIPLMTEFVNAVNRMQIALGTQQALNEGSWQEGFLTPEDLEKQGFTINIPKQDSADKILRAPKIGGNLGGKIQEETVKKIQQAKAVDIQGGVRLWIGEIPAMDVTESTNLNTLLGQSLKGVFGGQPQHIETSQEAFARQAEQTLSDTQQVYSGISSIIGVLNVGTDTFVSKIIGGFNTVLTIMEAIKTVNSILSIIPGFASGGIATGLFMAGEKGPELVHVGDNQARVYNHNETMRMMNPQSTNPNVNVYLSANISEKFITAKIEQYTNQKRFKRV